MEFLKEFAQFDNGYDFKLVSESPVVIYEFINRDGVKFFVRFIKQKDTWFREYDIENGRLQEINIHDTYNVLKTVTNITIDFLQKFDAQKLQIDHLNTSSENKNKTHQNSKYNKRSILNSRYLRSLPKNYTYKMIPGRNGTATIISKNRQPI